MKDYVDKENNPEVSDERMEDVDEWVPEGAMEDVEES
jgi:hypothetical protein